MPLFHVLVLAIVQGITEFLPVSSSGHLDLTWRAFDAYGLALPEDSNAERLIVNVAVHVGTLFAVALYFRRDIAEMLVGVLRLVTGRGGRGARLVAYIVAATLPIVAVGILLKPAITAHLSGNVEVIAWATLGFGALLYLADKFGMTVRRIEHMTLPSAVLIGAMQILALVPGTSRAGITMTAARMLGFERAEAARFSLLLAIPAILGAGTLAGLDLYAAGNARLGLDALFAAIFAFVFALAAIAAMMRWLHRASFTPFVVYRVLLGGALLWLLYG